MRNVKTTLLAAALSVAALGSAAVAAPRVVGVYTGAHAAAMNQIYQANQQHNAVINSVQRNINNSEHRY